MAALTPVERLEKCYPLIGSKGIREISLKWNKRWPHIDQPWPEEGTFDPEVIKTLQVLIDVHEANKKTGKKGEKRKEKRNRETAFLALFDKVGQKIREQQMTIITEVDADPKRQMEKAYNPFIHTAPVVIPPPYES